MLSHALVPETNPDEQTAAAVSDRRTSRHRYGTVVRASNRQSFRVTEDA
jgi:hypothetical protein